jgi:hypothetical protein
VTLWLAVQWIKTPTEMLMHLWKQLVSRARQSKFLLVDIGASKGNRYKIAADATNPNYNLTQPESVQVAESPSILCTRLRHTHKHRCHLKSSHATGDWPGMEQLRQTTPRLHSTGRQVNDMQMTPSNVSSNKGRTSQGLSDNRRKPVSFPAPLCTTGSISDKHKI